MGVFRVVAVWRRVRSIRSAAAPAQGLRVRAADRLVLFYTSYPRLPVVTLAVMAFVYPLVTLLLDYVLYGRRLAVIQLTGLGLIVLGTLGVNLKWTLGVSGKHALARNT